MSIEGMRTTILATQLGQAVSKDEQDPDGFDLSGGLFGPAVSELLRTWAADAVGEPLIVCTDKPPGNGMYVAYVDEGLGIPFAGKELLMYIDGRWGYRHSDQRFRGKIVGWFGPIPALPIEKKPS
jgi:hypothetical protein